MADSFSPKERVIKAINHEEPDRVPIYITITPQLAEKLRKDNRILLSGRR